MKNIQAASSITVSQSIISEYNYNAFFGRLNYNWKEKYIFNLTGRRDGSSRFGSANLFHNFGSIGAAWLFSNEPFASKKFPFLSFGKLKGSYGTTGNDQIGDYQFMALYDIISGPQPYQGATGLIPTNLSNPYLQWEETKKIQFGIDLGFLRDNILLNANYYHNRSSNQLQYYFLPFVTGFNSIQQNLSALIQNSGWEFTVSTNNLKNINFSWSSTFNLTIPKNKLIEYPDLENSSNATAYIIGQPITLVQAFKYKGVDPQTGIFLFQDEKGNITSNPVRFIDQIVLENSAPTFYGGFQNNFQYKGFQLDFLFQFVKQRGFNYNLGNRPGAFTSTNSGIVRSNQPNTVLARWQSTGDISTIQKFSATYPSNISLPYTWANLSNLAFTDASFIRLKNISISWQLPKKWKKQVKLQDVKLYFQGQNIFTITNYIGLDPENRSTINLPPLRILTVGIQALL